MKQRAHWFPAKRYGWGWSWPCVWQGWVVLAAYICLLIGGVLLFPPQHGAAAFVVYTSLVSSLLVGVCYLKGEPPKWRWGK
jgi:hypothetical protein